MREIVKPLPKLMLLYVSEELVFAAIEELNIHLISFKIGFLFIDRFIR